MKKPFTLLLAVGITIMALAQIHAENIRMAEALIFSLSEDSRQLYAKRPFGRPPTPSPDTALANIWFAKAKTFTGPALYDSAIVYYKKASVVYKKAENWGRFVQCYNYIGKNLRKKGSYDIAMEYFEQALETGLNELGEKHPDIAVSHYNIGVVYSQKNDYDKALEYLYKSLSIRLQTLGKDHPDVAGSYNGIGSVYYAKGDFDKTLEYLNKSLSIRLQTLGNDHPLIVGSYNNIGLVCIEKGDYDKAFEYFNKSLAIELQSNGEGHSKVAGIYRNIGNVYYAKGDFDKALEYYIKSLTIKLQTHGEGHPGLAGSYNNIGLVYIEKCDYDKAFEYFNKSLTIKLQSHGEAHPDVATFYLNFGLGYIEKGDYDKALEYLYKSLSIRLQLFGEEHPDVATCYHNIGNTFYHKGDYDKALEYHNKSLALRLQLLGGNHLNVATCYNSIGLSHMEKGDFDKALEYLNKSLSVTVQLFGDGHLRVARDYNNIGLVYKEKCDYDKALEYFNKSLSILLKLFDGGHNDVAMSYNNIGIVYLKKEDFGQALYNLQKSIQGNVQGFADDNFNHNPPLEGILSEIELERSLYFKAKALASRYENGPGNIEDLYASVSTFQLTFELIDKMRNGYKAEGSKLILAENTSGHAEDAIEAALQLYEATGDTQYQNLAFSFAEKNKAGVLYESVSEANARQFSGIPDSLLQKERQLKTDLAFYETQIQKNELDSLTAKEFKGRFFNLNVQYDQLIRLLERAYPGYFDMKYDMSVATVGEIQNKLQENNKAFIEYFIGEGFLYTFVITKDTFAVVRQAINPAFYSGLEMFSTLLRSPNVVQLRNREMFFNYGRGLYDVLIRPVENIIKGSNGLVIIPVNMLNEIPFGTLISSAENPDGFNTAEYLLKRYAITYHFSATLYLNTKNPVQKEYAHTKQWSGFAPVFSDAGNNNAVSASNLHAFDTVYGKINYRAVSVDGKHFNALPYSGHEVKSIGEIFERHGQASDVYLNDQATEEGFKAGCGKYKYIHLATHSIINPNAPKLSGIIFSQPQNTEGGQAVRGNSNPYGENSDDGILYAGEVYNLDIAADLVVLSSCESGIGKLVEGEGMMALTRGLLYAGAQNQMASLWKIEDKSSAELMISFYGFLLSGNTFPEALRNAKLKMIEQNVPPVFWGAYVLIGE